MASAEQPRDKPLHELLSHHMVDIYVGSANTHWILHEKLLCSKSKFFNSIFYTKQAKSIAGNSNKKFGLPDEEDEPFRLFVGWLYSGRVPRPEEEKDIGDLFDLYLMGEKWQITSLVKDVLDTVRKWYRNTDTFPGLRRVQYIYANTDEDSAMRLLLIGAVARMLVLGQNLPAHWERALGKNGKLAVDIIRAVQRWNLNPDDIPDTRQEAQKVENEMVKDVERAEQRQTGVPKDELGSRAGQVDDAAQAGHDIERLAPTSPNGNGSDHAA